LLEEFFRGFVGEIAIGVEFFIALAIMTSGITLNAATGALVGGLLVVPAGSQVVALE